MGCDISSGTSLNREVLSVCYWGGLLTCKVALALTSAMLSLGSVQTLRECTETAPGDGPCNAEVSPSPLELHIAHGRVRAQCFQWEDHHAGSHARGAAGRHALRIAQ